MKNLPVDQENYSAWLDFSNMPRASILVFRESALSFNLKSPGFTAAYLMFFMGMLTHFTFS
jgi:hypothetical protein